ncbi:MAG: hypothetical protein WC552_01370 [Candidatus Omnitrophota bacterium]
MGFRQKLVVGVVLVLACGFAASAAQAAAPEGETYYTTANIWYEDAEKPISVNYHKGTMIPAGTKVKIDLCKKDKIKFTTESGVTLVFLNSSKYSTIKLPELFDRYFSKDNPTGGLNIFFSKFNAKEKENIKKGTIAEGMSKEAVLMAYGYPPSHRTPDLKSDTWAYWDNRFVSFRAVFKDNRLIAIEHSAPKKEKE